MRRGRVRRDRLEDLSVFSDLVDAALEAFQTDVSYAVAMSRAAAAVERKREVWAAKASVKSELPHKED